MDEPLKRAEAGVLAWIDRDITEPMANFQDPKQEWRRPSESTARFSL